MTNDDRTTRRDLIKVFLTNTRDVYTTIADAADQLAAATDKIAPRLNEESEGAECSPLVSTPEDWADLITAVLNETRELMEWQLIERFKLRGWFDVKPNAKPQ